jgi:hypothetical protein
MTIESIENFEFYADLYPIIRDRGWEVGHMSWGSVRFLRKFTTDRPGFTWLVGIVTRPGSWEYCWRGMLHGTTKGRGLKVALDAPFSEVYAAAKACAEEWLSEYDEELKHLDPQAL